MRKIIAFAAALCTAFLLSAVPSGAQAEEETDAAKTTQERTRRYCIGSCSKMFAVTAAMQLADEGKIDIDAPVTEYIPEFTMEDQRYKKITVRMLMDHSSGLYGTTFADSMLLDNWSSDYHDKFLSMLKTQKLKADPGEYGCYCNDGYSLLELVIERASGEDYSEYIEKHICAPMGLDDTGTVWSNFDRSKHIEVFNESGQRFAPDYTTELAGGGIISTAEDLCRFGSAFFSGNETVLSDNAKAEMTKDRAAEENADHYGLGWDYVVNEDYNNAGVDIYVKGGDLQYQHAQMIVAPDEQISVAVVSNTGNSTLDQLLAQTLMDIALEEKGISISHPEPDIPEIKEIVPEKYSGYDGLYADTYNIFSLTFPQMKYMELELLTADRREKTVYKYTEDGSFIKMDGDMPARDKETLRFCEKGGKTFIYKDTFMDSDGLGHFSYGQYEYQQLPENNPDTKAVESWKARSGKKYYFCSGGYSDMFYASETIALRPMVIPEAEGFLTLGTCSGGKIVDGGNAEPFTDIPSSANRDISSTALVHKNGCEYISRPEQQQTYICEDDIPQLGSTDDQIRLNNGQASWYHIGKDIAGKTARIELPERSSVYVYDRFDRMVYSSFMKDRGSFVPLPADGKIVFIGQDGGNIKLTIN